MKIKTFDHEWIDGVIYVWRDDGGVNWREQVVLEPVVTHHQRPDSHADNPDDFRGYVDWHFEVWDQSQGWRDEDTREAMRYAAGMVDEQKLIEQAQELAL